MWERIKSHPLIAAGVILVLLVVFYVFSGSSGSAVSSGVPMSDVATGDALQMAQLQAQTIGQQTAAAVQANSDTLGANLEALKLQLNSKDNANALAANIASQQINASVQSKSLTDTLAAGVANNQINATVQQEQIRSNTQIQTTAQLTNALVQQAAIASNTAISVAQSASKNCGLIGSIFGC